MKIALISDTHLEFERNKQKFLRGEMDPPNEDYDVVVLAGDIGSGFNGVNAFRERIPAKKPIVFLPGNHCFYGKDYAVMNIAFQHYKRDDNVFIMAPGQHEFDGVTIIGATLWSQCTLPGYNTPLDAFNRSISDFRVIKYGTIELFSVARMQDINRREALYIKNKLETAKGKKVVVTHFLPTIECIAPRWRGDALNPYFCNDLDDLVAEADLWLFGHTHERMDFISKTGTRLVSNPHGYPGENREEFKWKVIEV